MHAQEVPPGLRAAEPASEASRRDRIRAFIPRGSVNAVAIQLLLDYGQMFESRAQPRLPRQDSAA